MAFSGARGEHILLFVFAFAIRTLLCSLHILLGSGNELEEKSNQAWKR
jgi:hypothetical protein